MRYSFRLAASVAALVVSSCAFSAFAQLVVSSTSPSRNANNVDRAAPISVTFDRAVNPATFTSSSFKVFGKLTGPVGPGMGVLGTVSFSNGNHTVTMSPSRPFAAGEVVMVLMSNALRAADGTPIRSAGYTFMYTTATARSSHHLREIARVSNRVNGVQTRIYGGLACDLNRDGWCDITTVNEVSADLRVFLNRADGSGLFQPMLTPFTPIPTESSPNEVADFNNDGFVDVVVASNETSQVALCMGLGNGRFQTPVLLNTAAYTRGFAIMDCDGDGDFDFAVACASGNVVQLFRNNGNGTFAAPTNIQTGGDGEYGMTAADMNNDGILDLVVGCLNSQTVHVMRGNGNGTFTSVSSRSLGGANWVIQCGDLNNDGNMDVSAANSPTSNASILLGNGDGTLQPVTVYNVGGSAVSTDLADLDGDGDLDWIVSSFGAGIWYIYLNDGSGHFTPLQDVDAPNNPSCAVPMDIDNDGDIDLVLTDEIADVMVILENLCDTDFNDDGFINPDDLSDFITCFFLDVTDVQSCPQADFNGDGFTDPDDLSDFITRFFLGGC